MRKRWVLPFLFVAVMMALQVSGWAQGCSGCRTALEQSEEGQAIAGSFNYGILFLMGIPYAMFGTAGWAFYRAYRKHLLKRATAELPSVGDK
jgi:hypothetical protein